jgi:membrane protein YqaA with SNARE-associated domain
MTSLTPDFFFETVLPRLLTMTVVSFVIGSFVGAIVGAIARQIGQRRDPASVQPQHGVVYRAMFGSFIGMLLICMLPILANPTSLSSGSFSGLSFLLQLILLAPLGSILGAVVGILLGAKLPTRLQQPKWAGMVLLVSYLICTVALYLGLAPPPVTFSTPRTNGPFPVVTQIKGYETFPSDLALSDNGQQLAIADVRYGKARVEVLDLPTGRVIHRFRPEHAFELVFNQDSRELITVGFRKVQVQDLSTGMNRLRVDGDGVAYPMAGNKLATLAVVDPWKAQPNTGLDPSSLKVWDLTTGKLLQTIPADLNPFERSHLPIAVSPDRKLLAFPPALYGKQIQVWDITTGKQVSALVSTDPAGILDLAFSPDGKQLAVSLGQGAALSTWDWQAEKRVKTIAEAKRAQQLFWAKPGIFVQSDSGFQVWDPQTGKHLQALDLKVSVRRSTLSADRTTLAVADPQQGIWVWRVDKPT